jgi:conjugative transposon TraJ protein
VVLAILGPLSFALSIYDGFHSTLTNWIARYISVYLWLPVADIFSAVLSKIRALMLESDIALLQDPSYIPDGTNGVYIVFLIIGIIGYFSIPTVAEWIIQSGGGASGAMSGISKAGAFGAGVAGGIAGNAVGKVFKRKGGGKKDSGGGGGDDGGGSGSPDGQNLATQDDSGGGGSGGYGDQE